MFRRFVVKTAIARAFLAKEIASHPQPNTKTKPNNPKWLFHTINLLTQSRFARTHQLMLIDLFFRIIETHWRHCSCAWELRYLLCWRCLRGSPAILRVTRQCVNSSFLRCQNRRCLSRKVHFRPWSRWSPRWSSHPTRLRSRLLACPAYVISL